MSDKPTESSPSRRPDQPARTAAKAGRSGRARSSPAPSPGPPAQRRRRVSASAKKVPTGGTVTWALEQDPGCIYPFGGTSRSTTRRNELMYDSLLEWDPKLNIRPALAESYEVVNPKRIVWNSGRASSSTTARR